MNIYVIPGSNGSGPSRKRREVNSIETWIEAINAVGFNPKPPTYWMDRKRSEGSIEGKTYSDAALGMIWYRRYDLGRRAAIWLQAPERDWIDAGYLVQVGEAVFP